MVLVFSLSARVRVSDLVQQWFAYTFKLIRSRFCSWVLPIPLRIKLLSLCEAVVFLGRLGFTNSTNPQWDRRSGFKFKLEMLILGSFSIIANQIQIVLKLCHSSNWPCSGFLNLPQTPSTHWRVSRNHWPISLVSPLGELSSRGWSWKRLQREESDPDWLECSLSSSWGFNWRLTGVQIWTGDWRLTGVIFELLLRISTEDWMECIFG